MDLGSELEFSLKQGDGRCNFVAHELDSDSQDGKVAFVKEIYQMFDTQKVEMNWSLKLNLSAASLI